MKTSPPAKEHAAAPALALHAETARRWDPRLALLFLLTLPWWIAVTCPFIHIDDPLYIWQNPHLRDGLTAKSIRWAFTNTLTTFYLPVTWLSLLLDVSLFGTGPMGMHFTNVLLHLANTFLLYAFLRRTTGSAWRSFIVTAFFCIHPLRVESVAWVTERKDVLSAFFGLWALLAYHAFLQAAGRKRLLWYLAIHGFLMLSLLAKPMLVTLPFLLLLLDVWPLRRLPAANWRKVVLEKVPLLLPPLLVGVITLMVQEKSDALESLQTFPLSHRVGNAALSYFFYVRDTFYFLKLSVFYPKYRPLPVELVWVALAVLAGLTAGAVWISRRGFPNEAPEDRPARGAALIGWLWFLGTLVPVIGLVQSGVQSRADRFTYWPSIGLFMALVYPWPARLFRAPERQKMLAALAAATLFLLAFNTSIRLLLWRGPVALYRDGIANTTRNDWLKSMLGNVLMDTYEYEEAEVWLRSSLIDHPSDYDTHVIYAILLHEQRRWPEALHHYEFALRLRPGDAKASQGHAAVIQQLQQAQQTQPSTLPKP